MKKEREKAFNSRIKDLGVLVDIDLAKCTQRLENEFRRPNMQLEEAEDLERRALAQSSRARGENMQSGLFWRVNKVAKVQKES